MRYDGMEIFGLAVVWGGIALFAGVLLRWGWMVGGALLGA